MQTMSLCLRGFKILIAIVARTNVWNSEETTDCLLTVIQVSPSFPLNPDIQLVGHHPGRRESILRVQQTKGIAYEPAKCRINENENQLNHGMYQDGTGPQRGRLWRTGAAHGPVCHLMAFFFGAGPPRGIL